MSWDKYKSNTVEEFFTNNDNLDGLDIVHWVRWQHPHWTSDEVGYNSMVLKSVYEGWLDGIFIVNGDNVILREWEKN